MSTMWCRHHNMWPIFSNQYCSLQQQFSDGVCSLLNASNLLSSEKSETTLCPMFDRTLPPLPGGTQYFSWTPFCPRDVAFLVCGWFLCFLYMWVFTEQKGLFFVFFLIQGFYQEWWPSPLWHFSVYIVKFSKSIGQGVLGKSKFMIVIMKLWN